MIKFSDLNIYWEIICYCGRHYVSSTNENEYLHSRDFKDKFTCDIDCDWIHLYVTYTSHSEKVCYKHQCNIVCFLFYVSLQTKNPDETRCNLQKFHSVCWQIVKKSSQPRFLQKSS